MLHRIPLSWIITLALTVILVIGTFFNAYLLDRGISSMSVEVTGQSMELLANQLRDKIDRLTEERVRDLSDAASLNGAVESRAHLTSWIAARGEHDDPTFTWIGLVSADGTVATENGVRPGSADLASWPGLQRRVADYRSAATDAEEHAPTPRTREMPDPPHRSFAIDVSVPLLGADGAQHGILAARLSWQLIRAAVREFSAAAVSHREAEYMIISPAGALMFAGPEANDLSAAASQAIQDQTAPHGFILAELPNSGRHVLGYARSENAYGAAGAGWTVLAQKHTNAEPGPAAKMHQQIWSQAAFFVFHAIFFAAIMARIVCAPILKLALSADAIRAGAGKRFSGFENSYREAHLLSHSLTRLVEELQSKEAAKTELASSLERQVADRTQSLTIRNRALEVATKKAAQATQSKSRYLAIASHDLRQPLQALMIVAKRLERRISSGENSVLIGQVNQSVATLSNMLNALLDMSRLESGIVEPRPENISLPLLLGKIADDFRTETTLEFRYRCGAYMTCADPVLLEAMVRNLLANAAKFTSSGTIALFTRRRGGHVAICVYDTGVGIAERELGKIFAEFERSPKQAGGGTNQGLGLGLSIVHQYALLLGAKVEVSSRIGHGSCFRIILPLVASPTLATDSRGQAFDEPSFWRSASVLLLDDDPRILTALTSELRDKGASVAPFASSEEAKDAIQRGQRFDIYISDYHLGLDSGVDFIVTARGLQPTPFMALILTGRTDAQSIDHITGNKLSWLPKPADSRAIAERLFEAG